MLVKICRRKSKKPYLGKKNVYKYEVLSIGVPSRFHKDVEPFLGKDFELSLKAEKSELARALSRLAQLNQSKVYLFWEKNHLNESIHSLVKF